MENCSDTHNLLELQDFLAESKEFWQDQEKEIDNLLKQLDNPDWNGFTE